MHTNRGCNNVTAIVYIDCGKTRDRGRGSGGDNASGRLEGIERGPRKEDRDEYRDFSEKEKRGTPGWSVDEEHG